jgi:hypothetical protein
MYATLGLGRVCVYVRTCMGKKGIKIQASGKVNNIQMCFVLPLTHGAAAGVFSPSFILPRHSLPIKLVLNLNDYCYCRHRARVACLWFACSICTTAPDDECPVFSFSTEQCYSCFLWTCVCICSRVSLTLAKPFNVTTLL